MIQDLNMTRLGTRYNYTLDESYWTVPGTYIVNGVGDLNGKNKVWSYTVEVNPTGITQNSFWDNSVLLIFIGLGVALLIFGVAVETPWLGFLGSVMFLLGGVYIMIYGFNNITDMYTRAVAVTLLGLGIVFMFVSAFDWVGEY
jgi:hypothetical protein